MQIAGKLTGANSGYIGHTVEVLVPTAVDVPDGATRTQLLLLRADVADDGSFTLNPPDDFAPQGLAEVAVRAPSGARIALLDVTLSLGEELALDVNPASAVGVDVEEDPFAASLGPVKLFVQLIDTKASERVAEQLVSIWGRPRSQGPPEGEPERVVLGAAYTDKRGLSTIDVPRRPYESVVASAPADGSGREPAAFELTEEGLPQGRVTLAVELPGPASESEDGEETCACEQTSPPRTPGHAELVGATGVYATDLGVGTCPTPAVPNRTLEEYRYYSLVRTTDPDLFGVKIPVQPRPLSETAIKLAGELAYGIGTLDAKLAPRSDEVGVSSDVLAATGGSDVLDRLRLSSATYRTSGVVSARAWRETTDLNKVQEQILERASSLSEGALREALADPDGFTPVSLMTAERHAAFDELNRKLDEEAEIIGGRKPVSEWNMPQWDAMPKTYQAAGIAHGHVLEWRQVWRADGYSLGDLLYSLPLAPGQKRKIVVLDWDRRESAVRSETRTFSEAFTADLSRDRAVAEIINSTVTESIRAGSKTNTWGAGGGLGLGVPFAGGFFGLGVAGGGGGSSSRAWQDSARSLGAHAGQSLTDRTQQASAAVRSQRATVVVGHEQSESVAVTSEIVANYNHCHALTVEYFEVLKHYRVDQELAAVTECLFVPLQMTRFDSMKALR